MWKISQIERSGRVEHANILIYFNVHVPGKSKNYNFQAIMTLFQWSLRQSGAFLKAPFPSLCVFFFFFFSFYFLIDISQQKVTEDFSETSQCKRSIKSRQLQVTPNQREQLMQHLPGSTYVPSREQTTVFPQNPQEKCMTWNQALLAITCWCPKSGPVTDIPLLPSHCTSTTVGMSAGY